MKTLRTPRLILRPWKESDSKDLYEYAKSDLVGPNAGWKPHNSEEESKCIIRLFITENDSLAIVLKSENKVIGSIGLHRRAPDSTINDLKQKEIGYVLNPKYWRNGYASEALRCIIEYSFKTLGLDLLWCAHYDFNHRSKRVIEKCGFKYKFTKEETLKLLDNKQVTSLYYNIYKNGDF